MDGARGTTEAIDAEVVVVGAGLAGLRCADRLHAAGVDVAVLEARDRVGGRTLNLPLGPDADGVEQVVEGGGAWLGVGQDRLAALAEELGVATFPTYATGASVVDVGGTVARYRGTVPRVRLRALVDLQVRLGRVSQHVRRVDPERPWDAPGAERLDGRTLASVAGPTRSGDAAALFTAATRSIWGADPVDVGLLPAAAYAAAAGGLDVLLEAEGGAQDRRFVGGSQLLSLRLAERLPGRVRLRAPVRAVAWGADGVVVHADGVRVRARRLVAALSPPLAARIVWDPPLPPDRVHLSERAPHGALTKALAVYDEPFWRADGLSGQGVSDVGPAGATFDVSPPSGSPGVLLGFVGGRAALRWSATPTPEREAAFVAVLARMFGPRAARPRQVLSQDWSDEEWSAGCPTSLPAPGALTAVGPALRAPVGPVVWAGAETATRWTGYMDGAVRSGEDAAAVLTRPAAAADGGARSAG